MVQAADKTFSLYRGSITIDYWDQYHRYKVKETGEVPISVTKVTGVVDKSGPLIWWAVGLAKDYLNKLLEKKVKIGPEEVMIATRLHQERKKAAATSGTLVHAWAEDHIKGRKPDMPEDPKVRNGVLAFLKWVDEHGVKFEASESIVYSKKHRFVGLQDIRFTMKTGFDGKKENHKILYAGDIKTSKGFYSEQRFQVAAYRQADVEESGRDYGATCLVRFDKETAEFETLVTTDHDKDFKAFLGALALKRRLEEIKKEKKS